MLGPVLFTLYTQPLVREISKFDLMYHFYADDTQLYGSCDVNDLDGLITRTENCIAAVKTWMNENKLMLNDDKTEVLVAGSQRSLKQVDRDSLSIGEEKIEFSCKSKNLGVYLDDNLSMNAQINHLTSSLYLELRRISKVRDIISFETATLLVNSLFLSKLDYCNSLLSGVPNDKLKKLQVAQNNAARMIFRKSKREHASPLLKELHWLPCEKRIMYKLATMCHKCINDNAPMYLKDLLRLYIPSRTLRSSTDTTRFVIPKMLMKSYGERSFVHSGPKIWNSLPQNLREIKSFLTFKRHLKTYLFKC